MNKYTIDDIKIGMIQSFERQITEKDIDAFGYLTGDNNPMHQDKEHAKRKGFLNRISYGLLTGSLLSTLAGVYLPGENSLIHSVEFKFTNPVYPDDKLKVVGEVVDINKVFSFIVVKVKITNQCNLVVLRGKMQIGVQK